MRSKLTIFDKLTFLFLDFTSKILLFVFVILTVLFANFLSSSDIGALRFQLQKTALVSGVIDKTADTNVSLGGSRVEGYYYAYSIGDDHYFGESFSTAPYYDPGEEVQVEYLISDPYYSRIQGMNRSTFGIWPALVITIIWLIITLIFLFTLLRKIKALSMFTDPVFKTGKKLNTSRTNVKINDRRVFKLTYNFEALSSTETLEVKTTKPNEFGDEEVLIYSKNDPKKSMLCRQLPQRILKKLKRN